MGAHVSVCPNHQTGRSVSFELRSAVALGGTFGYELDITRFSPEEDDEIRRQIALYHRFNDLVREGRFYRLTEGFGRTNVSAWCWVSGDGSEALAIVVRKEARPCAQNPVCRVRIPGLKAAGLYHLEGGKTYHGSTLMNAGINVSDRLKNDASCVLLYFHE